MGLDRAQPFGTIHGDEWGRRYEQSGVYFGADGLVWDPTDKQLLESYVARKRLDAERAQRAADAEAERLHQAELRMMMAATFCHPHQGNETAGHGDSYMAEDVHLLMPDDGVHLSDEWPDRMAA